MLQILARALEDFTLQFFRKVFSKSVMVMNIIANQGSLLRIFQKSFKEPLKVIVFEDLLQLFEDVAIFFFSRLMWILLTF